MRTDTLSGVLLQLADAVNEGLEDLTADAAALIDAGADPDAI